MKGLRFERIANGRHYNVVFHIGSSYVPVSDETIDELKEQSLLPTERFLDLSSSTVSAIHPTEGSDPQRTESDGRSDYADHGAAGCDQGTVEPAELSSGVQCLCCITRDHSA